MQQTIEDNMQRKTNEENKEYCLEHRDLIKTFCKKYKYINIYNKYISKVFEKENYKSKNADVKQCDDNFFTEIVRTRGLHANNESE